MLDRLRLGCNLFTVVVFTTVAATAARSIAIAADGAAQPPAAGSQVLLDRLWTPEQLRAAPADALMKRLRPADHTPPEALPEDTGAAAAAPAASPPPVPGSIRRVKPAAGDRPVALTFDLCERADQLSVYDGAVINALRREKAPATFFAGGKWMRSHPERAMQLIADPLFEVGNHAWTHGNLRVMDAEKTEQQIAWTQREFALLRATLARRGAEAGVPADEIARLPQQPTALRFPYGVCSRQSLDAAAANGLAAIQWDVISGDASRGAAAAQLVRTVLGEARPGSIIVFHANGNGHGTAQALPEIIAGLRQKDFRLVTISELLRSGEPYATDDCYELRPGDNTRYDRLFGEGTG
ncbi:MAG: polysaccharide deacetylase family protein [Rhodospirillales bacterium]